MKATLPIVICDDEQGCDEFMVDYHEQCASNWRDLVPAGWQYDPYRDTALCPVHAHPEPTEEANRG